MTSSCVNLRWPCFNSDSSQLLCQLLAQNESTFVSLNHRAMGPVLSGLIRDVSLQHRAKVERYFDRITRTLADDILRSRGGLEKGYVGDSLRI
jgi:hypothetical protein